MPPGGLSACCGMTRAPASCVMRMRATTSRSTARASRGWICRSLVEMRCVCFRPIAAISRRSAFDALPTLGFEAGELVELNLEHQAGQPVIDDLRVQCLGQKLDILSLGHVFLPCPVLVAFPTKSLGYDD